MRRQQDHVLPDRRRGGPAHVPLVEQVRFLTRVRVCSPRQFGAAFDHDVWWAYKRIDRLCGQGLADRSRPLRELPGIVRATADGLAAAGLARSRTPRVSLDRLAHDLAVTELLLWFERTRSQSVIAERELWRGAGEGLIDISGVRGRRTHCPDLALEVDGTEWAVEVEFSLKGATRLRNILSAYRRSSYAGVVYYVREPGLARTMSRLATESDLGERLRLRAWELWPLPSGHVAEIEAIAREHRGSTAQASAPLRQDHPRRPAAETNRAAEIKAWEEELERRDRDRTAGRFRLRPARGA